MMHHRSCLGVVVLTIVMLSALAAWGGGEGRPQPASRPSAPASRPSTGPASAADLPTSGAPLPAAGRPGEWASYDAMHQYFVKRFVDSSGFGYERMVTPQTLARSNTLYIEGQHFRIGKVELISLGGGRGAGAAGDGAKAFAYEMPRLDAMKETIKKAKRRPLNEVEASALKRLQEGRESVLAGDTDRPTLVGAVRATADCLKCHAAKEGEMLGAFGYPLVPVEAPAERLGAPASRSKKAG